MYEKISALCIIDFLAVSLLHEFNDLECATLEK